MKILVGVLGATVAPYPDLIRTQKRTWASRDVEDTDVLYYFGGPALAQHGRDLYLPVSDAYWDTVRKTLAFFEHILAHSDFDLLVRTNCSSYVDLPNLRAWALQHARRERFYAGPLAFIRPDQVMQRSKRPQGSGHPPVEGWGLADGWGFFLSRDLVLRAVELGDSFDDALPDDTALAEVLLGEGVIPEEAPHVYINRTPWNPQIDISQFLFRCRTDSSWRRGDIDLMLRIDQAFARARGEVVPPWFTRRRRAKSAARALVRKLR